MRKVIRDLAAAAGIGCVSWGLAQLSAPAAWIFVGLALIAWAIGDGRTRP